MNTKRLLPRLALAGLVAGLLVWLFRSDPIAVDVATVARTMLDVVVEEQGKTRARYRYTVSAPITGRLLRTSIQEGNDVTRGQLLATIAPPPEDPRTQAALRAELAVAEAGLREAQAAVAEAESADKQAERELVRRRKLHTDGLISSEMREQYAAAARAANARLDNSRAFLSSAQAEVDRTRARLLDTDSAAETEPNRESRLVAPATGVVARVYEESERIVAAGAPLFEIDERRGLEVVIEMLTEEAVRVHVGDVIRITAWGGGVPLAGTVRSVEPRAFTKVSALGVEEQRVEVIGDIVEPPPSLGTEFRVETSVIVWSGQDVLTIPISAIFRRGASWGAFVVEGDWATSRSLELGHRGTERVEVISGLTEGEQVVVFPSDQVEDGVRVDATHDPADIAHGL